MTVCEGPPDMALLSKQLERYITSGSFAADLASADAHFAGVSVVLKGWYRPNYFLTVRLPPPHPLAHDKL